MSYAHNYGFTTGVKSGGLRPVLEGFVVKMHGCPCEQEVIANWANCDNKTRQVGLNYDYNLTFFYFTQWMLVFFHSKRRIWISMRELLRVLPPLVHDRPLNDDNCRLTTSIIKGRCARDVQPCIVNTGVFKSHKTNFNTTEHIYSNGHAVYGDMRLRSLHMRLQDAGHMKPN